MNEMNQFNYLNQFNQIHHIFQIQSFKPIQPINNNENQEYNQNEITKQKEPTLIEIFDDSDFEYIQCQKQIKLTSRELFETSKYFKSTKDFINLEFATKKCKGNMEKFKTNPITLTEQNKKYFPNVTTLNIFSQRGNQIDWNNYSKIIIWYELRIPDVRKFTLHYCHHVEYKRIIFTKQDVRNYLG